MTIETKVAKNDSLICKLDGKRVSWFVAHDAFDANPVGATIIGKGHSYTCIGKDVTPTSPKFPFFSATLFVDENGNRYLLEDTAVSIRRIAYNNFDDFNLVKAEETAPAIVEKATFAVGKVYEDADWKVAYKVIKRTAKTVAIVNAEYVNDYEDTTDNPFVKTRRIQNDNNGEFLSFMEDEGVVITCGPRVEVNVRANAEVNTEEPATTAAEEFAASIVAPAKMLALPAPAVKETNVEVKTNELPAVIYLPAPAVAEEPAPLNFAAKILRNNGCTDARFSSYDEAYVWIKDQENLVWHFESEISFFNNETLDREILYRNASGNPDTGDAALVDDNESADVEVAVDEPAPSRADLEAEKNIIMEEIEEYKEGLIEYKDDPDVNPTHIDFLKSSIDKRMTRYYEICDQLDKLNDNPPALDNGGNNPDNDSRDHHDTTDTEEITIINENDNELVDYEKFFAEHETNQPAEVKALNATLAESTLQAPHMLVRIADEAGNHRGIFSRGLLSAVHVEYNAPPAAIAGYTLRYFDEPLRLYDTFAQVNAAVKQFTAAITSNADKFTFPTVEELTPAPVDKFTAQLAEFDTLVKCAEQDIADAKLSLELAEEAAQSVIAARQAFLDKTAGDLTRKLHEPCVGIHCMETTTLSGCRALIGNLYNIYVDATLNGQFTFVNSNNREFARYDTPAHVEAVITRIKDAIAADATEFVFPTVNELTTTPAPPATPAQDTPPFNLTPLTTQSSLFDSTPPAPPTTPVKPVAENTPAIETADNEVDKQIADTSFRIGLAQATINHIEDKFLSSTACEMDDYDAYLIAKLRTEIAADEQKLVNLKALAD